MDIIHNSYVVIQFVILRMWLKEFALFYGQKCYYKVWGCYVFQTAIFHNFLNLQSLVSYHSLSFSSYL
jgi:hypothetical protein